MKIYLTDGEDVYKSMEVEDEQDLAYMNKGASESTDGTYWWITEELYLSSV